jgi:hypothetical protein
MSSLSAANVGVRNLIMLVIVPLMLVFYAHSAKCSTQSRVRSRPVLSLSSRLRYIPDLKYLKRTHNIETLRPSSEDSAQLALCVSSR